MKIYLRQARKERGLTLKDLEQLSGVSKSEISNIETGKVIPRLDVVCKIAKALGLPCTFELCDCDQENKSKYDTGR